MKAIAFAALLTLFFLSPIPNDRGGAALAESHQSSGPDFERMIRQAWDDFKNKKEKAFASVLADDVVEVEADGRGPRDKAATLADLHTMQIDNYSLSHFKFQ
jgi:hypothetical protein